MDQSLLLMRERARLTHSIVEALRNTPGAISLHIFGADAHAGQDGYSDIDLQLVTTSLDQGLQSRGEILRRVAPVSLEWVITEKSTSWAASVLFDGASPFHKLDIGFCTEDAGDLAWILDGSVTAWSQTPPAFASTTPACSCSPAIGSVEHVVHGELIGLTRYVRARRREQELVCWKFFQALVNRTLVFQFITTVDSSRAPVNPLLTHEYTMLQRHLPPPARDRLSELLAIASPAAMDRSVGHLARMLVHAAVDAGPVSAACQREMNRLLSWLGKELDIQDEPHALS
jgi:hypothetical protein